MMRQRLRACVALLASLSAAATSPEPARRMLDIRSYQMTFSEPFDSLSVSAWGPGTRWIAHTPWHGDFGDATFIDPEADAPFHVSNGLLTIRMQKRAGVWQSGLLSSADQDSHGFVQAGGYFEVRAKFPGGNGVWPAIWLGSNAQNKQPSPEIDIAEYYGHDRSTYLATVHVWDQGKSLFGQATKVPVSAGLLESGFHLYGVSIDAKDVVFYLDRREVGRVASRPEFMQPMYLMIDLGAGGGWPIDGMPAQADMVVDYARAYRLRDQP